MKSNASQGVGWVVWGSAALGPHLACLLKSIPAVQNCPMLIPYTPDVLVLPIVTYWDGAPCTNTCLHGVVTLGAEAEGLCIAASLPYQGCPSVPVAPPRTRVAN